MKPIKGIIRLKKDRKEYVIHENKNNCPVLGDFKITKIIEKLVKKRYLLYNNGIAFIAEVFPCGECRKLAI